jgi:hypothetical protein
MRVKRTAQIAPAEEIRMQLQCRAQDRALARDAGAFEDVAERGFEHGLRVAMRPLLAWHLRAGFADERVELFGFDGRKLCALPRSYLRRGHRRQFVRPGFAHENLDLALCGSSPFLRREFGREFLDGTRALREALAQVFDAADGRRRFMEP